MRWFAAVLAAGTLWGQPRPAFEAASVKLNSKCDSGGLNNMMPGRLELPCMPLRRLIQIAYGDAIVGGAFTPHLIDVVGGPSWLDSDRYDIAAKAEGTPPQAQMLGPMLQALLEDRFQVKVHKESRETAVYLLTLAKASAKLHPIKEGSCIPMDVNNLPKLDPGAPAPKFCGSSGGGGSDGKTLLLFSGITMAEMAGRMARFVDHPVVDTTGLTGRFDIHLEFVRNPDSTEGPSIFAALEEQLGLKLVAGRSPLDVIVVDRVEKPSAN